MSMFAQALIVFLGGGLGCVVRYMLGSHLARAHNYLPVATLIANLTACIIFGLTLFALQNKPLPDWQRLLILIGFCGGLSTFSTFSFETYTLIKNGMMIWAITNAFISVTFCTLIFYFFNK